MPKNTIAVNSLPKRKPKPMPKISRRFDAKKQADTDVKASKLQRLSNGIDTYVTIPAAIATGLATTVLAVIWFFTSLSIPELSLLAIVIPAAITLVSMITSAALLGPEHNERIASTPYMSDQFDYCVSSNDCFQMAALSHDYFSHDCCSYDCCSYDCHDCVSHDDCHCH